MLYYPILVWLLEIPSWNSWISILAVIMALDLMMNTASCVLQDLWLFLFINFVSVFTKNKMEINFDNWRRKSKQMIKAHIHFKAGIIYAKIVRQFMDCLSKYEIDIVLIEIALYRLCMENVSILNPLCRLLLLHEVNWKAVQNRTYLCFF